MCLFIAYISPFDGFYTFIRYFWEKKQNKYIPDTDSPPPPNSATTCIFLIHLTKTYIVPIWYFLRNNKLHSYQIAQSWNQCFILSHEKSYSLLLLQVPKGIQSHEVVKCNIFWTLNEKKSQIRWLTSLIFSRFFFLESVPKLLHPKKYPFSSCPCGIIWWPLLVVSIMDRC